MKTKGRRQSENVEDRRKGPQLTQAQQNILEMQAVLRRSLDDFMGHIGLGGPPPEWQQMNDSLTRFAERLQSEVGKGDDPTISALRKGIEGIREGFK